MTVCNLYAIYDSIAKEAGAPFDAKNDEIAKRKFEDVINTQIRPVKTVSLSDYELRQVGQFYTEQCAVTNCISEKEENIVSTETFRLVCRGDEVNLWPEDDKQKELAQQAFQKIMDSVKNNSFNVDNLRSMVQQHVSDSDIKPIKTKKKHFWSK